MNYFERFIVSFFQNGEARYSIKKELKENVI